jgi:release factor glutamine methyltransferase
VAQENLRRCALTEHAVLLQGSWVEPLQSRFDMVISNPPYIGAKEMPHLMPEVRDYEPAMALTAGEDGLDDYRMLLQVVPPVLNPGGCFILELGAGQAEAVCALAEQANWTVTQLKLDMAGIPRALTLTR